MSNCSEDTGVDELGYAARTPWQPCVSAKWREQQLKHAFSITLGKMLQNGPTASGDVEVPYLKAQHVQWDEIRVSDLPRMWASSAEIDALQLRKGDLLVCEGGDVGRSAILRSLPQDPTNCGLLISAFGVIFYAFNHQFSPICEALVGCCEQDFLEPTDYC